MVVKLGILFKVVRRRKSYRNRVFDLVKEFNSNYQVKWCLQEINVKVKFQVEGKNDIGLELGDKQEVFQVIIFNKLRGFEYK